MLNEPKIADHELVHRVDFAWACFFPSSSFALRFCPGGLRNRIRLNADGKTDEKHTNISHAPFRSHCPAANRRLPPRGTTSCHGTSWPVWYSSQAASPTFIFLPLQRVEPLIERAPARIG